MPLFRNITQYFRDLPSQLRYVGVPAAALGLWRGFREPRYRRLTVGTLAAWLTFLLGFHALANLPIDDPLHLGVMSRFWLMPNLFPCVWIGLFFTTLELRRGWAWTAAAGTVVLQLALAWPAVDRSGETTIRNYGMTVLESLPQDALVLTRGDLNYNALIYLRTCEGVRRDVVVLDQELMTMPWTKRRVEALHPEVVLPGSHYHPREAGAYSLRQFLRANEARKVYVCGGTKPGDDSLGLDYESWPYGFCERLVVRGAGPTFESWLADSEARLPEPSLASRPSYAADRWEAVVVDDVLRAHRRRAEFILDEAIARGDDRRLLALAAELFRGFAGQIEDPAPSVYKNLGIACARLSRYDPSHLAEMAEAWRRYLRDAPPDDPDLSRIRSVLENLESDRGRVQSQEGIPIR